MRLYHASPKHNLESIKTTGLDPDRSTGKEKAVWLHTRSRRDWAILHTCTRHKCDPSEVIIIAVDVPRSRLRRRWRGLWTTPETLTEFASITDAREFTESPMTA